MPDIFELMNRFCPDGVPYYRLDQVFDILQGYSPSMDKKEYWEGGTVPFFRMENLKGDGCKLVATDTDMFCTMDSIRGKPFPGGSLIMATCATIGVHALVCEDFLANQQFSVLKPAVFEPKIAGSRLKIANEPLDMDFANYYAFELDKWCKDHINEGTFAQVNMVGFRAFPWPVPPLQVQREIVAILDKFDSYCNSMTAGLAGELEMRRKQYRYWRNRLFQDLFEDGCRTKKLKEITLVDTFKQVSADALKALNTGFGDIQLLPSSANYDWRCELTDDIANLVNEGKVITLGRARYPHIKYHHGKFIASQNHIIQSADEAVLSPEYLYCFLEMSAPNFYTTDSSYPLFTRADYNKTQVPVPDMARQLEIVEILDKFRELERELEHELELRQRQYEYYRDMLLSFPERKENA